MKTTPEVSPHTLTFFAPLKEESSFSNSGLLQSFFDLFNSKKTAKSNKSQNVEASDSDVPVVFRYKVEPRQLSPQDESDAQVKQSSTSSTSATLVTSKPRSYSSHSLNDDVLSRPNMLHVSNYYNAHHTRQGSEVELRMKNFSNLLKDLPKKMGKNTLHSKESMEGSQWERNDLRQYWMPDEQCHECYECNERFTTFRRRHHCRICGHIFCSRCCFQLISGQIIGYPGMIRTCTYCYKLVTSDEAKSHDGGDSSSRPSTTETDGLPEVHRDRDPGILSSDAVPFSRGMLQQRIGRTRSMVTMRNLSPSKDETNLQPLLSPPADFTPAYNMFDVTPNVTVGPLTSYQNEQVHLAKHSMQLHTLWIRITGDEDRLEFRDHRFRLRKYCHTVSGEELVEWLLSHQISSTRDQACGIGQALMDAELIKNIPDVKDPMFHEECLYSSGRRRSSDEVHRYVVDADSDVSSPIAIPPGNRISFDQTSSLDAGNEPNWVREIDVDGGSDVSSTEDLEESKSWGSAFHSVRSSFTDNPPYLSPDEYSSSPHSAASLSSYIEIDNQRNVIKYNKRSNQEDTKARKEVFDLKEPRFIDENVAEINADYIRGYLSWHGAYSNSFSRGHSVGWRETDMYNSSLLPTAKQAFVKLQKLYANHSMQFLSQLFKSKKLDVSWSDIIVSLAKKISESVVPNCEANMDIKHYVHVKKLLDGPPQDSRIVNGVVFTKNVVSNRMRTRIDNPVIMLLATPLEYQRVHNKIASLDPVVRQEPEFFKNLTSRLLKHQPDVVISQCSVAHVARRLLQEAGITLVINVKKSVMERLSRCTGGEIVKSVDQMQNVRLGTCARFRVLRHSNGKRSLACSDGPKSAMSNDDTAAYKTMIYVDGCRLASGCTVLLRNNPDYTSQDADSLYLASLFDVKSVFLVFVQLLYHCKLELSYLMDQQDLAATGIPNPVRTSSIKSATPSTIHSAENRTSVSSSYRVRTDTADSFLSDANTITTDHLDDDVSEKFADDDNTVDDVIFPSLSCENDSKEASTSNTLFRSTLLSYSPLVPINLPFLLSDTGKSSPLYSYLPKLLYWSEKFPQNMLHSEQRHRCQSNIDRVSSSGEKTHLQSEDFLSSERLIDENRSSHFRPIQPDEKIGKAVVRQSSKNFSDSNSDQFSETRNHSRNSLASFDSQSVKALQLHEDYFGSGDELEKDTKQEVMKEQDVIKWIPKKHSFLTASFSKPGTAREMQDLLADFRANGSSLQCVTERPVLSLNSVKSCVQKKPCHEKSKPYVPIDCLELNNHQHIFVLFSSYSSESPNAPYPCVIPWAVEIDFYKGNDITFGGFLERYCFRPGYHCPNTACNRPMIEHIRSFVYGNMCINIVLKELSKPVLLPAILSWCWNPETKSSTDLKVVSHDARSMSFAKYLELRFQTFAKSEQKHPDDDAASNLEVPPFTSYQYFLYKDIVAAFKCFPIRVYDIALPPRLVSFQDVTSWIKTEEDVYVLPQYKHFVQLVNVLSKLGYESMDAIRDMIIGTRSSNPFETMSGSSDYPDLDEDFGALKSKREAHFDQLMAIYQEERCHLRDSVDKLYLDIQSLGMQSEEKDEEGSPPKGSKDLEMNESPATPSEDIVNAPNESQTVRLAEETRNKFSWKFLKVACLISELVDTWNTRVSSVVEQDRQSRKLNRNLYYDLYVEQPLALQSAPSTRNGKNPPHLATLEESQNDDEIADDFVMVDGNSFAKPFVSQNRDIIKSEAIEVEAKPRSEDDKTNQSKIVDKTPSIPVPPSRAVEKSGPKKMTRSSSTMNVKYLVNQFRSSTIQTQVRNPFPADEHYLLPNCCASGVLVRDSEPSSIIAYTLKTPEYLHFIESGEDYCALKSPDSNQESFASLSNESHESSSSPKPPNSFEDHVELPSVAFRGMDKNKLTASSKTGANLTVSAPPSSIGSSPIPSPPLSPSLNSPHLEVQFKDSTTKFYCKVYFASHFKNLRRLILNNCEDGFVFSLTRCIKWAARGGKSGSAFHKSLDDRLVIKQLSRFELQSFLDVAQHYFDYVTEAVKEKKPTALSKILGVYRISYKNTSSSRTFKQDVLVMENLFYQKNIKQVFDLKGSVRNRHVKTESETFRSYPTAFKNIPNSSENDPSSCDKSDLVLLDENLLRIMRDRPLYVHEHTKIVIKRALSEDAKFLANHLIIDYSLLVGIDNDKQEIVVGIIDYLRTFTWDKKIEMVVKSYGMIGRQGTRSMPTVVSPEMYRTRFCEAMERYFQVAPDRWYALHSYRTPIKKETES